MKYNTKALSILSLICCSQLYYHLFFSVKRARTPRLNSVSDTRLSGVLSSVSTAFGFAPLQIIL